MFIDFHGQQFAVSRLRDGEIDAHGDVLPHAAIDDFMNKRAFPVVLDDDGRIRRSRAFLYFIEAGQREFSLRLLEAWS